MKFFFLFFLFSPLAQARSSLILGNASLEQRIFSKIDEDTCLHNLYQEGNSFRCITHTTQLKDYEIIYKGDLNHQADFYINNFFCHIQLEINAEFGEEHFSFSASRGDEVMTYSMARDCIEFFSHLSLQKTYYVLTIE